MRSVFQTIALAIGVVLSAFTTLAQPKEPFIVSASVIDKNLCMVTDSLYAYCFETSNSEYRQFLKSIRAIDEQLYNRCLWDTMGWDKAPVAPNRSPLWARGSYERHPALSNFPAVNMSYEGAIEYCKWLTELYNKDPNRNFKQVVFSLPTQKEWKLAAYGGKPENLYPWGIRLRSHDGKDMCKMLSVVEELMVRDTTGNPTENWDLAYSQNPRRGMPYFILPIDYTEPVKSYEPNGFGLYNMSGNVAEMVLEKGICKGGSFNSYGGEVQINFVGHYTETLPELGFRVFMKIIEK